MFRKILTPIAIVEAVWPETLIDAAEEIALDNPDECEWKSWVYSGTRLIGLLYVIIALTELRKR